MSEKFYLYILKGGIFLSLLSALIVWGEVLFPYISAKQIYFNVLLEILTVFWVVFLIKFPKFRPKKSWITWGLLSYFIIILVSCFTGVDFNLSFWGDIERMLGFFHLFHFFLFYLIIITVFRSWEDWRNLFIFSLAVSFIVSVKALTGKSDSTIGNTSYVAGYLIFNIYFCFLVFVKAKDKLLRWLFLLPILIMLPAFKVADSSGGYVGLGFSFLCILFLYGILNKNKKIKKILLSVFVILVLLITVLLTFKNQPPFKDISFLRPVREISLQKDTFQTRLISWRAALKDLPNHLLLGTGFGNYAVTFDKYFEAKFYSYTSSETFFDRAHNNLIDIVSTTGILGLLTYLIAVLAAFYYLIINYYRKKIDIHNFVLIFSLLVAYLVQNLAVFDSLVTYISIMMVLGYIFWLNRDQEDDFDTIKKEKNKNTNDIVYLAIIGIVAMTVIYQYNYKPLKMLTGTIDGLTMISSGNIWDGYETYQKALSYKTPLDRDSRYNFIRLWLSNVSRPGFYNLDKEKRNDVINFAIDIAKKNVDLAPHDVIANLQLAQVYNVAGVIKKNFDNENPIDYFNKALASVNEAIANSPNRITTFFTKVQILLNLNRPQDAVDLLESGVKLNKDFPDSYCNLADLYLKMNEQEKSFADMDKCIELGGVNKINSLTLLREVSKDYGSENLEEVNEENLSKLIKIFVRIANLENNKAQNWINLAKIYERAGDNVKAIEAAQKATQADATLSSAVESYVRQLSE